MQYEWAQPGRLVVCVDGALDPRRPVVEGEIHPERGKVYIVREVAIRETVEGEGVVIRLDEIVNRPLPYFNRPQEELWFRISRFRPVNTQIIDSLLRVEENA